MSIKVADIIGGLGTQQLPALVTILKFPLSQA